MQVFLLQAMSSEPRFTRLQALAWLAQVLESLSAKLLIPYGEALIYLVHSAADPRLLVGPSGLEPPTSCLSGTRSNHLSYEPSFRGAPDGIYRAYSPLSFLLSTTILLGVKGSLRFYLFLAPHPHAVVEMMGFEPMTPCLQGRCSPSWATPPSNQIRSNISISFTRPQHILSNRLFSGKFCFFSSFS